MGNAAGAKSKIEIGFAGFLCFHVFQTVLPGTSI